MPPFSRPFTSPYVTRFRALLAEHAPRVRLSINPRTAYARKLASAVAASDPSAPTATNGAAFFDRLPSWHPTEIIIVGWNEHTDRMAYITALHELGHVMTTPEREPSPFSELFGVFSPERKQDEVEAWRWAIPHLTPELLDGAIRKSGHGLTNYGVEYSEVAALHAEMIAATSTVPALAGAPLPS